MGIPFRFGPAALGKSCLIIAEVSSRIFHFNAIDTFAFRNYLYIYPSKVLLYNFAFLYLFYREY